MKCIKAIRESKGVQVGDIKRVDDKTAINMVGLSCLLCQLPVVLLGFLLKMP